MRWRLLACWLPVAGLACLAALVWAAIERSDRWSAPPFVALLYGLWLSVAAFFVACALAHRKNAGALPAAARELGFFVSLIALLTALWVFSPWLEPLVGWCVRKSSNLRFR